LQEPEEKKIVAPVTQLDESATDAPLEPSASAAMNTPPLSSKCDSTGQTLLPQYVNQSLLSEYLYPINNLFSETLQGPDMSEEEMQDMSETGITTNEEEEDEDDSPQIHDSIDNKSSTMTTTTYALSEATSFFGAATSTLLLNAKANIPDTLFSRPSFFDDDDSDEDDNDDSTDASFRKNDPIYQRVEQNKINPPQPRSSQQSIFQSGE